MGSCLRPHAELVTGLETEHIQSHHPVFSALYLNVMWLKEDNTTLLLSP